MDMAASVAFEGMAMSCRLRSCTVLNSFKLLRMRIASADAGT